ncbi:MAG: TfuA-like protein [Paracoccaceae bacterium]|nr:TfuA-like protein [Paracoccaceae bacterium]
MIIVLAGPSIATLKPPCMGKIEIRPPAQQGDIYLAALEKPDAIGVIDGYFEGVPALWHKEILWAMAQGIPVMGASSMGALRAAELEAFGMIGVGAIFEDYRDEKLEDDDEVALLHGPQEVGYPALSLAMVNVRATLKAAREAKSITHSQTEQILKLAKSEFYKTRTWDSVFGAVDSSILSEREAHDLRNWIKTHGIDQKKLDAMALIDRLENGQFELPQPNYHFEETDLWLNATKVWRQRERSKPNIEEDGYRLLGSITALDE